MDTIVEQNGLPPAEKTASPWTMLTALAVAISMIAAYKMIDLILYGRHLL